MRVLAEVVGWYFLLAGALAAVVALRQRPRPRPVEVRPRPTWPGVRLVVKAHVMGALYRGNTNWGHADGRA